MFSTNQVSARAIANIEKKYNGNNCTYYSMQSNHFATTTSFTNKTLEMNISAEVK